EEHCVSGRWCNGEARLLLAAAVDAVARGVPALLARDPRSAGATARRRAAHPALRADAQARRSLERRAGRRTPRAGGVRRHRRAVVGQRRGPRRGHRDGRRARRRPGAARGRAPLHRPRALAPLGVRAASVRGAVMGAPVRLIVWSDYLCPWCYVAATRLHRLREEFGDQVELEWRSYLLRPHPDRAPTLEQFRTYTQSWARPAPAPVWGRRDRSRRRRACRPPWSPRRRPRLGPTHSSAYTPACSRRISERTATSRMRGRCSLSGTRSACPWLSSVVPAIGRWSRRWSASTTRRGGAA